MIPRKDFVRILEKKGKQLVEDCRAVPETLMSDLVDYYFLSPKLRKAFPATLHSKFDRKRLLILFL